MRHSPPTGLSELAVPMPPAGASWSPCLAITLAQSLLSMTRVDRCAWQAAEYAFTPACSSNRHAAWLMPCK